MSFEDDYMDVLQNLEFGIVRAFRENQEIIDANVDAAFGWLLRYYRAEKRGRPTPAPLGGPAGEVAASMQSICELRLGREQLETNEANPLEIPAITSAELQTCLKRIRKSVRFWSREGGRQGYLDFIIQYVR